MKPLKTLIKDSRVPLLIFAVAVAARAAMAILQLALAGTQASIALAGELQTWADFYAYYTYWLQELGRGLLPYGQFWYQYPPLFLYTLFPFYLIGAAQYPILASDAVTAVVIYYFMRERGSRVAVVAGTGYALSPFALVYEGYSWMSVQPMLLFALLAVYYLRRKPVTASSLFAVAVLFKAEALFLSPVFLYYVLRSGRAKLGLLSFAGILFLVSLPFLILAPATYLSDVTYDKILLLPYVGPYIQAALASGPAAIVLPGLLTVSALTSAPPVSSSCSFLFSALSALTQFCTVGTLTETIAVTSSLLALAAWIAAVVVLVFVGVISIYERKVDYRFLLAFSTIVVLTLVTANGFFTSYKYYFLPVYALLLVSADDTPGSLFAAAFPLIPLLLPFGDWQAFLAASGLLGIMVIRISNGRYQRSHRGPLVAPQVPDVKRV